MKYRVFDVDEVEGRRKPVGRALGITGFGVNRFDSEPGQAGFEHDECESGQEEVYVPLAGSGVLRVDGVELELRPGRYVLVAPEATRQTVAGREGLSYLVVGGVPGISEAR